MKIDLHTHSVFGSACSRQTVERIAADAKANGIDAVCLTDHGNMRGRDEAQRVSEETGLPIFMGIEVADPGTRIQGRLSLRQHARDRPRPRRRLRRARSL